MTAPDAVKERLEYLRSQINAEQISMGEIAELQGLADQIDPSDVQLLEWAGVPEFPETEDVVVLRRWNKKEGGSVIALFPEMVEGRYVNSYEHVGQHGDASYASVVARTVPAKVGEPDTDALIEELTQRGYNLVIRQRRPSRR